MVIGISVQARSFRAGLRPGDVIVAVNSRSIGSVEELLETAAGTGPWTLSVKRDGTDLFLVLQ